MKNPICPVCKSPSRLVTGLLIYPRRPDLKDLRFYRCDDHTDFYVGCHKGTDNPLGVLADKEHRKWKMACHSLFDPMWRNRSAKNRRRNLYQKLAHHMGIPVRETHFGMFSVAQLKRAYAIMKEWQ